MQCRRFVVAGRALSALAVVASLTLLAIGCGEGTPETGAQTNRPPEQKQANENMLKYMESQKKK